MKLPFLVLVANLGLGASMLQAQETIERPIKVVGSTSPIRGEGLATITEAGNGTYRVEVTSLTLEVKSEAKAQTVKGFRVGLMGPRRRKMSSGAVLGEAIPEEIVLSPGERFSPDLLVGVVEGEPDASIEAYEVCVALDVQKVGVERVRRLWIHYGVGAAPEKEALPEIVHLKAQEAGLLEKVSPPFDALRDRYLTGLVAIEKRFTEAGDLDAVLATQKERGAIEKMRQTTDVSAYPELVRAQTFYVDERGKIVDDLTPKLEVWLQNQHAEVARLQTAMTRAGRIDDAKVMMAEALRLKGLMDRPETIPAGLGLWMFFDPNRGKTNVVTDPMPDGADSPFSEFLWVQDRTVGPGNYEGGDERVNIKAESKGEARPEVILEAGGSYSRVEIFTEEGTLEIQRGQFRDSRFTTGLHGRFSAKDSIFDRTSFKKGSAWFIALWSAKFAFQNCFIRDQFFESWSTVNVGLKMEQSTFSNVVFPTLDYRKEGGEQIGTDDFRFEDCRFLNCEIPLTVLLMTEDCVFIDCRFVDDGARVTDPDRARVTVYLPDLNAPPPTSAESRFTIEVKNDERNAGTTLQVEQANGQVWFSD